MMKHPKQWNNRGVTLTELLVVLVIVSLLATIAIPVYVNKAQQARIATAEQEVREYAQALNTCGIIHGFFVPLHLLDDLAPNATTTGSTAEVDDLANSANSTVYLIDPNRDVQQQTGNQPLLNSYNSNARVADLYFNWSGPFINPQRVYQGDLANPTATSVRRDYPLDPWGQPYRLYSPIGLVGDGADITNPSSWNNDSVFNGRLTFQNDRFDRFAIVSFGPDSEEGTVNNRGDDIVYLFSGLFNETSFRAFF